MKGSHLLVLLSLVFRCLCASVVFASSEPEVLINHLLAERLSLKADDVVELSASGDMSNAMRFRVSAVYDEKADPYEVPLKRSTLKMHLPDLEKLAGRTDQLDLISIQVARGSNPRRVAERLNGEAIGFTAFSAQELASRTSTTFQVVSRFHKAIALITMLAGTIFIFALVVMRVEDQRKNLATMMVTGISRKTILKVLLLESTLFAFFASILGALLGLASAGIVNLYYQHYYETTLIFAHVTAPILMQALTISFVLGIIAGAFSWFRLRRLDILQELGR